MATLDLSILDSKRAESRAGGRLTTTEPAHPTPRDTLHGGSPFSDGSPIMGVPARRMENDKQERSQSLIPQLSPRVPEPTSPLRCIMAPHRSFLLATVVLLLTAISVVEAQSTTTTTTTITTTNSTASASFCEQCRDKGICTQAYKGSPGIFCGSWLSESSQRLACCCPASAQCAKSASNYECKCQEPKKAKSSAGTTSASVMKTTICVVLASVLLANGL